MFWRIEIGVYSVDIYFGSMMVIPLGKCLCHLTNPRLKYTCQKVLGRTALAMPAGTELRLKSPDHCNTAEEGE